MDNYVQENDVDRIDIIKIDIEGGELAALQGGIETLERFRPKIFMELNPGLIARAGGVPGELFELLHSLDYTVSRIDHDAKLTPILQSGDLLDHQNVCCNVN